MVKSILILDDAWEDIIKISSYYISISEDLSLEFERYLFESLEILRLFPTMYPVNYRNVRRKLLKKFPYAIYFYIDDSFVRIIAVAHQRQNPESIRNQLKERTGN